MCHGSISFVGLRGRRVFKCPGLKPQFKLAANWPGLSRALPILASSDFLFQKRVRFSPCPSDFVPDYFLSALKLLPPTTISLILTSTKLWRWPWSFLYCFLRL